MFVGLHYSYNRNLLVNREEMNILTGILTIK